MVLHEDAAPAWVLRWEAAHPFFRMEALMRGHALHRVHGHEYTRLLLVGKNRHVSAFFDEADLARIRVRAPKLLDDSARLIEYFNGAEQTIRFLLDGFLSNYSTLSSRDLFEQYGARMDLYGKLFVYHNLSRPEFFDWMLSAFESDPDHASLSDPQAVFATLTAPVESSVLEQEECDWLELLLREPEPDSEERLRVHAQKYAWIGLSEHDEPFSIDHYRAQLAADCEKPVAEIHARLTQTKTRSSRRQTELENRLAQTRLSPTWIARFETARRLAALRLRIRLAWVEAALRFRPLFDAVQAKTGVSRLELEWHTLDEIGELLVDGKKVSATVLHARRTYALHLEGALLVLLEGDEVRSVAPADLAFQADFVKGAVANPGFARGRVKIIHPSAENQSAEIARMNEGDILVTKMTRPHLIVAIRKAAAIVTDEGGVTSHAAIVAREFDKPCVIGTGNATRVFADGDLVEVDAANGVVRKVAPEPNP